MSMKADTIGTAVSTQQVDRDLAVLLRNEVRSWTQIAEVLDRVERNEFWRRSSGSFTEWLKAFSRALDLKEASLWRYLAAFRFYRQLQKPLARALSSSPLDELPDHVSPDNLDLLSRLVRVLPDDAFQQLAAKVMEGTITRDELRDTWQTYRSVLAGRTARGKGVSTPRFNSGDPVQFNSMLEAQVLAVLSAGGAGWTGTESPSLYELVKHVRPEFPPNIRQRFEFDAVAIVRFGRTDPVVLHGIEVRGHSRFHPVDNLLDLRAPYCDFLWLAVHEQTLAIVEDRVPDYVGLMVAHRDEIEIIRHAYRSPQSGSLTGSLAKSLLARTLGG